MFTLARNVQGLPSLFNPRKNIVSLWRRPEQDRFYALDGLRAWSILWIMAMHILWFQGYVLPELRLQQLFERPEFIWAAHGSMGVDIFFTLSGYLIGGILFREIRDSGFGKHKFSSVL